MPLANFAGSAGWLEAEDTFESTHMVYPYGVHAVVVRVDPETGDVTIERYAIAYDVGKAVNPKLVEGQIAGGLAQGVGGRCWRSSAMTTTESPFGYFRRLPDADRTRSP